MKNLKLIFPFVILIFLAEDIQGQVLLESQGGLKLGTTTITGDGIIRFHNGDYEAWKNGVWQSLFSGGSGSSGHWTQNGNNIYNSNSGNVGIGTTTPIQKLHIANSGDILLDNGATNVTMGSFDGGGPNVTFQIDPLTGNNSGSAFIRLFRSTNSTANHALMVMRGNNTTDVSHKFSTTDDSFLNAYGGNVGVGTELPTSKLTVLDTLRNTISIKTPNNALDNGLAFQNGGTAYSWNIFRTDAGNNNAHLVIAGGDADANISSLPERMRITDVGFVGINRPSPDKHLHVGGIIRASLNSTSGEYIEMHHGGGNGYINTVGDGDLDFRHDGLNQMSLTDSGKLVIGSVATPGNYNLYVENGILTEEVKVALENTADWSDDEFDNVPELKSMETTIEEKSHLFGMPSAQELVDKGYSVTDMDSKLLAQIEWLWMHLIEESKKNKVLEERVIELERLIISSKGQTKDNRD